MQFHRNSQHDDRRRRVLTEEVLSTTPPSRGGSSHAAIENHPASGTYGTPAFLDRQARVSDLIPQRFAVIALLLLTGLTMIAGLEALYVWMGKLSAMTSDGRVAAMDLDGEGSLAAWYSSLQLGLSAAVCWFVYRLRRHKQNDYHGRYRIWAVAAFCFFVMSIDEAGSLHEGFKELMTAVTGQRLVGDGSLWWVMVYGVVLGIVGLRLLAQLKVCRIATVASLAAAGAYVTAILVQLELLWPQRGAEAVMLEEGAEMVGDLLLLLAVTLFARYVIFEAEGRLTERAGKPKAAKTAAKREKPTQSRATAKRKASDLDRLASAEDETPSRPQRTKKRRKPAVPQAKDSDDDYRLDGAHPARGQRKLSKKERKALRREKQREQEQGLR